MEEIRDQIREEFNQALEMKITKAMQWATFGEPGKDFYYNFLSGEAKRTPQEHLERFLECSGHDNKAKDLMSKSDGYETCSLMLRDVYPNIIVTDTREFHIEQSTIKLFNEVIIGSKDWTVRNSIGNELDKPIKRCGTKGFKGYTISPASSNKNLRFRFDEQCFVNGIGCVGDNRRADREAVIEYFKAYNHIEVDSIEQLEMLYDFFQVAFEEYDKYKQEFKLEFVKKMNILVNMKRLFQCYVKAAGIEAKAAFKPEEHYDYNKHSSIIQLRLKVYQENPRISIEHDFPIEFWNASQSQIQEVAQRFINVSRCVSKNGFEDFKQEE